MCTRENNLYKRTGLLYYCYLYGLAIGIYESTWEIALSKINWYMQKFSGVALNQYEILRSFRYVYTRTHTHTHTHT